jgi:LacI family transcriptional regulator
MITRNEKVTIIDVAKIAGVSVGTASQALNKKNCVAKDTIIKVEEVARDLGYYPSFTAREFRFKKSKTISLR